jgi:hypothetical protein
MSKIIKECNVCGTKYISEHDWENLDEFYNYDRDLIDEFPEDTCDDCGGSQKYTIED